MNKKPTISVEKQKRLEKALRENLRKRKVQQREREDKDKASDFSALEKSNLKSERH